MRADEVKLALSRRYAIGGPNLFLTEVKTGPTWYAEPGELLKIDAMAIRRSWKTPKITAFEVKVSRSDFKADKKWPGYLEYCHAFYFACPDGLISPDELPEGIGLMWINKHGVANIKKKSAVREILLPETLFYHLVISHLESDRHPFFTDAREKAEAYLQDKEKRFWVARRLRSKLIKEHQEKEQELQNRIYELETQIRKSA